MEHLLKALPVGSCVLDLGSAGGSFATSRKDLLVVRLDLEHKVDKKAVLVIGDAASLPLRSQCCDLIIANHSLEHFLDLESALLEIGRVLKPTGSLFVSVPDASTLTDIVYRWLARGGGHVNPFVSYEALAAKLVAATKLRLKGTRTLCTSLSFLNSRNRRSRPPIRLYFLGGGTQLSLHLATYLLRVLDRVLKTRTCVYGWALYLGAVEPNTSRSEIWSNVCIRCGSSHSSAALLDEKRVTQVGLLPLRRYHCPNCGTVNLFTDDFHYAHLATKD